MDIYRMHGISESAFWRGIHAVVYALLIEYGDTELGEDKCGEGTVTHASVETIEVIHQLSDHCPHVGDDGRDADGHSRISWVR